MKSFIIQDKVMVNATVCFLAVFNAAVLSDIPVWMNVCISIPFLLIVPGWLVSCALRMHMDTVWGKLSVHIGFSLTSLMFCGLMANWIFPRLGIPEPLAPVPMLCILNIFVVVLFSIVSFQRGFVSRLCTLPDISLRTSGLFLIPPLFPLLAIVGAIQINNNGTTIPTLVLLGSIALFVMALVSFRNRMSAHIYPFSLYFIALSVLLTTSLRGWYITGHDIQLEYYVFQLTKNHFHWNIDLYRDAYNACLSITILPTIFADFLQIPDPYIYKGIFQVIFALCPVIVFLFIRKYTTTIVAFLAAFYFVSFPTFFNDMPMLNRQEISFLFFFLMLYVLFSDTIANRQKKIAGIVFACSMMVSHYSTTYIVVGLLVQIYILRLCICRLPKRVSASLSLFPSKQYISAGVLVTLLAFTFFWNNQLTKSSGGLVQIIMKTFANIHTAFQADNKSADISYSFFFPRVIDDARFIDTYTSKALVKAKNQGLTDMYPEETLSGYTPEIVANAVLPLTHIGTVLNGWGMDVTHQNYTLRQASAKVIQLLIGIGCMGLFFYKTSKKYDLEYVLACFVSMVFIFLMMLLPNLSLNYGLLRLFQQLLVFLGLPVLIGSIVLLRRIHKHSALDMAGILAVVFFLTISGFFSEITGGYYPQLNLNNAGTYYDAFYLHRAEIFSGQWLARSMSRRFVVHADALVASKLYDMGDIHLMNSIVPAIVQRSGYVYASETNTKGRTIVSVDRSLYIRFPTLFFDANKNLIYNNGSSRIYK